MSAKEVEYRYALANLPLGGSFTPVMERFCTVAMLRDARERDMEHVFWEVWLAKRRERLVWLTRTQRQWQSHTRRASKARHHDSIAIREKYVRCTA